MCCFNVTNGEGKDDYKIGREESAVLMSQAGRMKMTAKFVFKVLVLILDSSDCASGIYMVGRLCFMAYQPL